MFVYFGSAEDDLQKIRTLFWGSSVENRDDLLCVLISLGMDISSLSREIFFFEVKARNLGDNTVALKVMELSVDHHERLFFFGQPPICWINLSVDRREDQRTQSQTTTSLH